MKRLFCWSLPLLLTVVLGGVSALPARGQETNTPAGTNALTLEAAVGLALANNPGLRAAGARVNAAAGRAVQAGKWSNPELELRAEDWTVSGGGGFSDSQQMIGVAQTLPFPGKKCLDKQVGRAGIKLSEAELSWHGTELVRDVKVGFFRVLASERLVEVSTELAAVAESSADTARKRVEVGAAAYQEQLRSEVQLEQARIELAEVQRDLDAAKQRLATLLGRPDLSGTTLSGKLAETADARLMNLTTLDDEVTSHPSVTGAQANLERARLEDRRARLEPYPDVKVGVAGGRIGASDASIIEIGLTVPLPLLDRGKGRQQEARANVDEAGAELHAVRLQLQREWTNARERYAAAAAQVARYREQILPKATEALQLVRTGFEEGKFSFIDLVDTQRTTAESRLAYQGKLLELNIARAELEALLQPQVNQPATDR